MEPTLRCVYYTVPAILWFDFGVANATWALGFILAAHDDTSTNIFEPDCKLVTSGAKCLDWNRSSPVYFCVEVEFWTHPNCSLSVENMFVEIFLVKSVAFGFKENPTHNAGS